MSTIRSNESTHSSGFQESPQAKKVENQPISEENREKPKKTCGNALFSVDKSCGKPQGKRRKGFFRPASMLAILAFPRGFHSDDAVDRSQNKTAVAHPLLVSGGRQTMAAGMTKTALVRHMAEKLELTNKQVAAFLDLLAETAVKETKKNGLFVIPGLGRLVKAERKARIGRNPQTGEAIKIKAKTVVKFRVAKAAKDAIAPAKK
ncbi:MAG TPA: HU family DNA-binding protein [Acidobacteriaceae bacterium]|nr:HU family DNA-binding protein [Acidobacteriaceae bacterium]